MLSIVYDIVIALFLEYSAHLLADIYLIGGLLDGSNSAYSPNSLNICFRTFISCVYSPFDIWYCYLSILNYVEVYNYRS